MNEEETPIDVTLDLVSEMNEKALYPTDLKEAVIGWVERFGMQPQVLLDKHKCIQIFMERDGMDEPEALEYFDFNVIGAGMGDDCTPCFAVLSRDLVDEPIIKRKEFDRPASVREASRKK